MMEDDSQLLRSFVKSDAQDAFTELVKRHVNLVYSAALRQVGGDTHLASDITQGVFVALANNASQLSNHNKLNAWLYTTTRFVAAKAVRTRKRSEAREREDTAMREISNNAAPDPNWNEIRPVIDLAMHELNEGDRFALLLRYFEGRDYPEIASRSGLKEAAARKRVERALDKLRTRLVRLGITSSAVALGTMLSAKTTTVAPLGLAPSVTAVSVGAARYAGTGRWASLARSFALMQKAKLAIGTVKPWIAVPSR